MASQKEMKLSVKFPLGTVPAGALAARGLCTHRTLRPSWKESSSNVRKAPDPSPQGRGQLQVSGSGMQGSCRRNSRQVIRPGLVGGTKQDKALISDNVRWILKTHKFHLILLITVMGLIVSPQQRYVEVLPASISDCDLIWK